MGTDTFFVIRFENIPADRRSEITYTKVVCKVRPEKSDPNRTHITVSGNRITFPGDVGTPTASHSKILADRKSENLAINQ